MSQRRRGVRLRDVHHYGVRIEAESLRGLRADLVGVWTRDDRGIERDEAQLATVRFEHDRLRVQWIEHELRGTKSADVAREIRARLGRDVDCRCACFHEFAPI